MRYLVLLALLATAQGREQPPERTPALPPGAWKQVEITAYCGGPCLTCQTTGQTADGTYTKRRPYGVAVESSVRLGSMVYVPPGDGYLDRMFPFERMFKLDDRGGALDSEREDKRAHPFVRLDLRFVDHADAKKFGRKIAWVYFCERVRK